jgi:hypothetical protein
MGEVASPSELERVPSLGWLRSDGQSALNSRLTRKRGEERTAVDVLSVPLRLCVRRPFQGSGFPDGASPSSNTVISDVVISSCTRMRTDCPGETDTWGRE